VFLPSFLFLSPTSSSSLTPLRFDTSSAIARARIIGEASAVVSLAWKELRLLGAISGGNYIKKAEECRLNGDNINMIEFAQYAITTADRAPNIILFISPVALCVFTIWALARKTHS